MSSPHDQSRPPPSGRTDRDRDPLLGLALQVGLSWEPPSTNVVFSPVSIRLALGLVAAGAAGETLDQMLSFLGSPSLEELNSTSARLLDSVLASQGTGDPPDQPPSFPGKRSRERWGPRPRLSVASGVWVDKSLALKPSFQEVAASVYGAQSKAVDFKTQPHEAASEVNVWVEKETNGLIRDLIPRESIKPRTSLILATALYFGAAWEEPFAEHNTQLGDFHLLDGSSIVQTLFMSTKERAFIAVHDGFKVLRLPYHRGSGAAAEDGRQFSMCLFLPEEPRGLKGLVEEAAADPGFVGRHVPRRKVNVGELRVPKFRVSFRFEASEALRRLGLELPFSPSAAELTEMAVSASPSSGERLYVSEFHHRAEVEITEEGTVAAAAAAGVLYKRCRYVEAPVDFVADHPFLFAITEEASGEIPFLGCVVDPSYSSPA